MENDYLLHDTERKLLDSICCRFERVELIVNSNGVIDLSWTEENDAIRSILFIGSSGEAGAEALANILTGKVCPSGKLAMTLAQRYEDYPSAAHFSYDKEQSELLLDYAHYGLDAARNGSIGYAKSPVTVYQEDLLMGYRGFDTLGITPLYPFGFGLSYTQFEIDAVQCEKKPDGIHLTAHVKNTGDVSGREVVQLYAAPYAARAHGRDRSLQPLAKSSCSSQAKCSRWS